MLSRVGSADDGTRSTRPTEKFNVIAGWIAVIGWVFFGQVFQRDLSIFFPKFLENSSDIWAHFEQYGHFQNNWLHKTLLGLGVVWEEKVSKK